MESIGVDLDGEFRRRFEAQTIPRSEWTHRAHVRMAYLYVSELPLAAAIDRLRAGIEALNRVNGVHDTPSNGYHETVTIAWATIVAERAGRQQSSAGFDEFADRHADLFGKDFLLQFYSHGRLFSAEARAAFVAPDRAPLPESDRPAELERRTARLPKPTT
jgi:hypothetical protein